MSQNIYDDVISIEELNRGQRAEVEVVIYESADTVRRHDSNTEMEATNSKRKAENPNTDSQTEDVWKWVDNSTLTTKFWFKGEPNDYGGKEDCVISGYKGAGSERVSTWADFPCSHPVVGICEKKMNCEE
ncbi:hypothetical protein MHYP_G00249080 [Metynnis hypsauchen]